MWSFNLGIAKLLPKVVLPAFAWVLITLQPSQHLVLSCFLNACPFDGGRWRLSLALICISPDDQWVPLIDHFYLHFSLSHLSISFFIVLLNCWSFFMLISSWVSYQQYYWHFGLDDYFLGWGLLLHDYRSFSSDPGPFWLDASSKTSPLTSVVTSMSLSIAKSSSVENIIGIW